MKRCLLPLLLLLAATLPELLPAQTFEPTATVPPPGSTGLTTCHASETTTLTPDYYWVSYAAAQDRLSFFVVRAQVGTPQDIVSDGVDVSLDWAYRYCTTSDCDQASDWGAWTIATPETRADRLDHTSGITLFATAAPNGATVEAAVRYLAYTSTSGATPACGAWGKDSMSIPVGFDGSSHSLSINENASGATTPIRLGTISAIASGYGTRNKLDSSDNPLALYSLTGDSAADFAVDDSGALTYIGSGLDYESKSSYTLMLTADNSNPIYRSTSLEPTSITNANINGGTSSTTVTVNVVDADDSRVQSLTVGAKTVTAANSDSDFLLAKALGSYRFEVAAAPANNPAITGYRWNLSSDWPIRPEDRGVVMTTANNRTISFWEFNACGAATPNPTNCSSDSGNTQKTVFTVNVQASDTPNPDVANNIHWGPVETFTVVLVPNGGPVFDDATLSLSLAENEMGDGMPVELGQVMATDPEGDPVAYCLAAKSAENCPADDGNPDFALSRGGVLTYTGTGEEFDADTPPVYSLTIYAESKASSPGGAAYADYYNYQATTAGGDPVSCRPCRRIRRR